MKILTIDVGTGTQDIFLYNSRLDMENNFKLVVPSPTMMIHQQIKQATRRGGAILLSGVTMGGGPCAWAAEAHLRQGYRVYATPRAARTFNDDLEAVKAMGVVVIGEDEAEKLPDAVQRLKFTDFDFPRIESALHNFGIELDDLAAVAVGAFDHGAAPVNVSDRQFRFDYLDERIRKFNRLSAFAYPAGEVPEIMTRLQSVVDSGTGLDAPLVVMDTAPAAVLGATLDLKVASRESVLIANIGNFHTLAFRLGPGGIEGLFEHHTGLLDLEKLENFLVRLADGTLRGEDVFNDQGHGALVYEPTKITFGDGEWDVVITGPRRSMYTLADNKTQKFKLHPYFPAPFGDMMITGCFGLLAATADVLPDTYETIHASLNGKNKKAVAPWDAD
jgi:uncharacterized protein (DUF1786 family)